MTGIDPNTSCFTANEVEVNRRSPERINKTFISKRNSLTEDTTHLEIQQSQKGKGKLDFQGEDICCRQQWEGEGCLTAKRTLHSSDQRKLLCIPSFCISDTKSCQAKATAFIAHERRQKQKIPLKKGTNASCADVFSSPPPSAKCTKACVLLSPVVAFILFLDTGTVLWFGIRMRIMLITLMVSMLRSSVNIKSKPFLLFIPPLHQGSWGGGGESYGHNRGQEARKRHSQDSWPQLICEIFHTIRCHAQHTNWG